MYELCGAQGKVVGTLAEKGDFNALMAYTGQTGQKLDYMYLLQSLMMNNPQVGGGGEAGGQGQGGSGGIRRYSWLCGVWGGGGGGKLLLQAIMMGSQLGAMCVRRGEG